MSDPKEYTVGWICALNTEFTAAQVFLDEVHQVPETLSPADSNSYALGTIGKHRVVIAVLPDGEYGLSSATGVAKDMLHSFPNIKIGMMVGIGGGAPSAKHDIRLGDIVVSASRDGNGGVFQYDFGKTIQNQTFQPNGFLNQSPISLRAALNALKTHYEIHGHQIQESVNSILEKNRRLRKKYQRPALSSDRLYRSEFVHPEHNQESCAVVCGDNLCHLVTREERTDDEEDPAIHYGLIASANQLMKDASIRDRLTAEKDILCFEMEAAGLMNHFPCIVIRGICDYSDSHKNKEWQGYAAMVAAAYAKDLLRRVHPAKIEHEKRASEVLSNLQTTLERHNVTTEKQLKLQETIFKYQLSEKQEKCLQLFRLTTNLNSAGYEWYKDQAGLRAQGTCGWFLNHENFLGWSNRDSGPLFVSADPGCGKSVLARYLIDEILPRSSTVCYFFFKDQDQNLVSQALCALLHQLFSKKPSLIEHAMGEFKKNGQNLIHLSTSLWSILQNATRDPEAGSVIIVLDALDECVESEFSDLMQDIKRQIYSAQSEPSRQLKFLLTSRPYDQITDEFRDLQNTFPFIRIPGEDESENISQEISHVIKSRVKQLSNEKGLSEKTETHLALKLSQVTHRTYLWVYLVFDYLRTQNFKKTIQGINVMFESLPKNVNEAYERILDKAEDHPMVRQALNIIFAAKRPLTIPEMNIALAIDANTKSVHDLDLEEEDDFKSRLRTSCGLFVSVHQDKIYFLHQTAREFLDTRRSLSTVIPLNSVWQHSIISQGAHQILAEICVIYLDLLRDDTHHLKARNGIGSQLAKYGFLDYSANEWSDHYLEAHIRADAVIIPAILRICTPDSSGCVAWFEVYWSSRNNKSTENVTSIMISSYFGHETILSLLLEKGEEFETKDTHNGRTPLGWAACKGHEAAIKLLIEKGADFETNDSTFGRTPLSWAASGGDEAAFKLLLEKGANFETKDNDGETPLLTASKNGHDNIVKLLLEKGANFETKDNYGETPLLTASKKGHDNIVKLLLESGADFEIKDRSGRTPLSLASRDGHEAIVKLLLGKGADFETRGGNGYTPLLYAAENGHETVAKILLEKGAHLEAKDKDSMTPLLWAAGMGRETIVNLLLGEGADFDAKNHYSETPLFLAAEMGHQAIVKLLLDKGADFETKNDDGQTPLFGARERGHQAVVKLLLEKGADSEMGKSAEHDRTHII